MKGVSGYNLFEAKEAYEATEASPLSIIASNY